MKSMGQPLRPRGVRFLLALAFLFVFTEVVSGLLRWFLSTAGVPWLIYAPKLLVSLTVLTILLAAVRRGRIGKMFAFALFAVLVFTTIGAYYTGSAVQAAFGAYGMLPVLLGVLLSSAVETAEDELFHFILFLWTVTATGVVLDYFYAVPWEGYSYQLGGAELLAARDWLSFGFDRLSGFSRASYAVANQLLLFGIGVACLGKSRLIAVVVWLLSGILIGLTTTKTSLGVFAFFTLVIPFTSPALSPRPLRAVIGRGVPIVVAATGVLLPIGALLANYSLSLRDPVFGVFLESFQARVAWTWPDAFRLVAEHGNLLLGRGIGGIGTAQSYFEPGLYAFSDNLFVHLYVSFGVLSLVVIVLYASAVASTSLTGSRFSRLVWCWAVAVLMIGWTSNVIEGAETAILLGFTWAFCIRGQRLRRKPAAHSIVHR